MRVCLTHLLRRLFPTLLLLSLLLLSSIAYLTSFSDFSSYSVLKQTDTTTSPPTSEFCPPPNSLAKRKTKEPNQIVCLLENHVKKQPAECHGEQKYQFECQWTRYWQLYTNHQLLFKYDNIDVLVQPLRTIVSQGGLTVANKGLTKYSDLTFDRIVTASPDTVHDKVKNHALLKSLDKRAKKNNHLILDLHTTNLVLTSSGEIRIIDMNILPARWFRWSIDYGFGTKDVKLEGMDNLYGSEGIKELYS